MRAYWDAVGRLRTGQARKLPVVEWLLDSTDSGSVRRSGRTTLMALAFVRNALSHPGKEVRLFDHVRHSNKDGPLIMADVVGQLLNGAPEIKMLPSKGAIMVEGGWTHEGIDPTNGPFHLMRPEAGSRPVLMGGSNVDGVVEDVVAAAMAAVRLGADPGDLISAVRSAVVRVTIED